MWSGGDRCTAVRRRRRGGAYCGRAPAFGALTRLTVCFENVLQVRERSFARVPEHCLDELGDLGETDIAVEKSRNRDFICGIENDRRARPRSQRFVSEAQTRETRDIGRFEVQRTDTR